MTKLRFLPLLFSMMFILHQPAMATDETDLNSAAEYVEKLANEAISIMSNENITKVEVADQVKGLLEENMAIDSIGRIVLGRTAWTKMDDAQRAEYERLFRDYLLIKYSNLVGSYTGQKLQVAKSIRAGKSDAMVYTLINQESQEAVTVGWRIRTIDGKMKLLDVKIADISMVQTERDQFQSVFQNSKVDGLMSTLKDLVEKMIAKRAELQAANS